MAFSRINNSIIKVISSISVAMLFLFLCSTPIAWIATCSGVLGSIILKATRFLLVIIISFIIRKRSQSIFAQSRAKKDKYLYIIIGAICVSVCLHYMNITTTLYGTISHSIGIYSETMPPFLSILWEQIFAGDLFWSILISLLIVFFDFECLINKRGASENGWKCN